MLIYLDHAHLAALELLMKRDRDAFTGFLERWVARGCQLVVSRAHLHEIGQSGDGLDVESKLELLRYFSLRSGPVDENVDWVIIREIRYQTLGRLAQGADAPPSDYRRVRDELYRPADHEGMRQFVRWARPGWLDELQARRSIAEYENRAAALRKRYQQISGKKKPKWNPESWKFASLARRALPAIGGDPVGDRWMAEVTARTEECWRRAKGEREAMICIYDIQGMTALDRMPLEDLSRMGFYRALGRQWVAPYCRRAGFEEAAVREALDRFDPYEAPAASAALAVERGRKRHGKAFEASDFMDIDHVLWAAHADLAFVDKRTYGFLDQARNDRRMAELLSPHLRVRFERAATLDEVERRVDSMFEEGSAASDRTRVNAEETEP